MNTDRIYLAVVPVIRPFVAANARRRRAGFRTSPPSPDQVVFLGDSLTQRGRWDELFPELDTLNRGIDGDTTEDLLDRLGEAFDQPAAISLLIGANDLHTTRRLKDPAGIAGRVETTAETIRAAAPGAALFVNSMTPRSAYFAPRIRSLNERYRQIADRTGSTYVDLWPTFADENGALRKEYTFDNLHLSPAGYRAWSEVLRPLLAPFGPDRENGSPQ
ncbi:GDSL-type esterase/lipase family protein [Nocardia vinacea]|uniref:GDSL-type esterase/lipase family protein n=1 Tax=Nocardia vinacea TaxID=96468 RepID=A0ABZ1YNE5_9NOCA|nr:GDSL-type esterase/lipase family protein [Nocardia vinacea]